MRLTRVYIDAALEPGGRFTLTGSAAGHLTRVLRLGPRAALTLFNGRGGEYAASIEQVRGGEVTVAVGEHRPIERESPFPLTLAQGVSRGERMDLVVQKATELGAARLVPVLTERSIVRLDEEQSDRKSSHWRAIAIAACEQCGRNRLPEVALPTQLSEFLRERAFSCCSRPGRRSASRTCRAPHAVPRFSSARRADSRMPSRTLHGPRASPQ